MLTLTIKSGWPGTVFTHPMAVDAPASAVARPRHGQVVVFDDAQAHRRTGVK